MKDRNDFDPDNISKEQMNIIADSIEEYLDTLKEVMIIPQELLKEHGKKIKHSIEIVEKLIKKLRKGDRSVFKDAEDWNVIP